MGKKLDLKNRIFGKLTVLSESPKRTSGGDVYWLCRCDCGNYHEVIGHSLVIGKTTACLHCANTGKKRKIDSGIYVNCLHCGKSFRVSKYRTNEAKFCSRSCNAKYYYRPNTFTMKGKKPWNKRLSPEMKRLSKNFSQSIRSRLNNAVKSNHWETVVGYSINELKTHLEKQFKPGMTWDNYGEWHIDHKIPISAFNFKSINDIDFKKCWALNNLQPLWKEDNFHKHITLEKPFQPSFAF